MSRTSMAPKLTASTYKKVFIESWRAETRYLSWLPGLTAEPWVINARIPRGPKPNSGCNSAMGGAFRGRETKWVTVPNGWMIMAKCFPPTIMRVRAGWEGVLNETVAC